MYVEDLGVPLVDEADARHLGSARRLGQGEVVVAADGAGSYRACRVVGPGGGRLGLEADGEILRAAEPSPRITIGLSLAKGDRTEWAVAKMTELGADRIVPLVCERTVVRPDEEGGRRRTARLRRVAREAAMQSRRVWLPAVAEPVAFAQVAAWEPVPALAEPGGRPLSLDLPTVLVGPEGGWSPAERAHGLAEVSLGTGIYRIETASVAATALLSALRSGLVVPR